MLGVILGGLASARWLSLCATAVLGAGMAVPGIARADTPTSIGLTGLVNMPTARAEAEGTWFVGYSYDKPYATTYSTLQFLPDLEISGRYTRISGVEGFSSPTTDYGDYKDKAAGFKLRILREGAFGLDWLPDVAVGMDDIQGTRIFRSEFIAMSKRFGLGSLGEAEATIGYGRHRIDGLYGGLRFRPAALPSWALVAEYDRTDYRKDTGASQTGVDQRKPGQFNVALEYAWGPLNLQLARQRHGNSVNVSLAIPLQQREFIPKVDEVGPFAGGAWYSAEARPTARMWRDDRGYRQALLAALQTEGLRSVRMAWVDGVMSLSVSAGRYRYPSRAVGRTARLAMAYAPLETHTLEITWEVNGVAGMTWTFFDVATLQRYFAGTATRSDLAQSVTLSYADPAGRTAASRANDIDAVLDAIALEGAGGGTEWNWGMARFSVESHRQSSFGVAPTFRTILNDPSGAFKYDIGMRASANLNLARGLWLAGAVQASVLENISDITQPSNSELPHVRSDLAEYRKAAKVKLDRLLVNKFWQPAERVYLRASAGLYEEMFAGAGGQALYLAPGGRWAFDAAVDVLRQRDYKGTGFLDYKTHTIIGSAHYRLPWIEGATATVRAGRFLAGDLGARFELKRTFRSGIEFGLWYTRTNGKDETSPGSPGNPYFDKGLFVRIPLGPLLTRDTGGTTFFSLAPWNRDVGQMVASPTDLYDMAEHGWLDNALDGDGLRGFGDIPTEDGP